VSERSELDKLIEAVAGCRFIPVTKKPYPQGMDFVGLRFTEAEGLDGIQHCLDDGSGTTGLEGWVTHWFPTPPIDEFM